MTSAPMPRVPQDRLEPPGFADGLGVRVRLADADGTSLEMLRVSESLASATGFDFALRERASRLANFRHAYYGRVRRVDRLDDGVSLAVVSERAEGARLSSVLEVAAAASLDLDVNAALCLVRQIVPAVALLHQNARDVSHGAIAPERIVVTPRARVLLVEYVLGAAIESAGFNRERLWKELRVAVPPGAQAPRLNHRADVMQIGVVALALVLGRPLGDDDLKDLGSLLASATENSVMGGREPISDPLRRWLSRALQLDPGGSFESALEAQLALDDMLSGEAGYVAAPVALESFLAAYEEAAAKMPPAAPGASGAEPPRPAAPVVKVPPPAQRLGVAKLAANAPAVPSFRAAASRPAPAPAQAPVSEPASPPAAAPAEPSPQPEAQPRVEPASVAPPSVPDAPPLVESRQARIEPAPEPEAASAEAFDEETLRAQFLAASGAASSEPVSGVSSWWRVVALVALVLAGAEGAFIAWRLASSPAGLSGTRGTLLVESMPVGAQVKVDGEARGVTPLSVSLAAGAHVVEVAAGGEPRVIPITIKAGETYAQYVELASISALGRLSIQSSPGGATVLLDGQPRGITPVDLPDVSAGEHELVLDLGGQRVRQAVTVAAGTTTTVNVPVTAPPIQAAGLVPPVPTTGALLVDVPFEMQVFENGTLIGVTGRRLPLDPGPHVVEIVSETLAFRATRRIEIVAGRTSRVPVALPKGTVHLNATPWAEVWIDGEKVGETPIGNLPLTIGPHEIVFRHPELGEQAHAATVTAAAPVRLSVDLTRQP